MEFGVLFWLIILAYFGFIAWQTWQRQRARQQLLSSLRVGDEVVTAGGLLGRLTALRDERVQMEVSPGVRLWMLRGAITGRTPAESVVAEQVVEP